MAKLWSFYGVLKRTIDKRRKLITYPKSQKRSIGASRALLERGKYKCFWVTKNIFSYPSKVSRYWKIGKYNGDVTGDFPAGRPKMLKIPRGIRGISCSEPSLAYEDALILTIQVICLGE